MLQREKHFHYLKRGLRQLTDAYEVNASIGSIFYQIISQIVLPLFSLRLMRVTCCRVAHCTPGPGRKQGPRSPDPAERTELALPGPSSLSSGGTQMGQLSSSEITVERFTCFLKDVNS